MSDSYSVLHHETEERVRALKFPVFPEALSAILRETKADDPNNHVIERYVIRDPGLAGSMLATVNSAAFGLLRPATSIQEALLLLGLRTVASLVTGLLLKRAFASVKSPGMQRYWDEAPRDAAVAMYLARKAQRIREDEAYTYGLFYRAGMPVLRLTHADYEPIIAGDSPLVGNELLAAEREHFGIDHIDVGAQLAKKWALFGDAGGALRLTSTSNAANQTTGAQEKRRKEVDDLIALGKVLPYVRAKATGRSTQQLLEPANEAINTLGMSLGELESFMPELTSR